MYMTAYIVTQVLMVLSWQLMMLDEKGMNCIESQKILASRDFLKNVTADWSVKNIRITSP